ncbi:Up-regulated during septation-domain-containing protein [Irpex rosettiformis]|uniref:Up-regulated during septation-domain-containing protein n=1 Tax=Irpex rosettiformis TaxID=378272 RepID=A0ACB8U480_9APHY|nr:Up-regulated during septation-domain-containing protein [Irpex rosettiformis]
MNGMRRYFGGGSGSSPPESMAQSPPPTTSPLVFSSKPSWPPSPPPDSSPRTGSFDTSPPITPALFVRKEKKSSFPPNDEANNFFPTSRSSNGYTSRTGSTPQSPVAGPSSPRIPPLPSRVSQLSRKSVGSETKRSSQMLNIRDDLLMSLLASEAIVDSRAFEILSAEEVEELKKEQQVLASRLVAMNKKLTLETKIRDAAVSLSKANAAYKNVSKQSSEQLEGANRRVETAQKDLWRMQERANEVNRKLLEHRAGVLSHSVRSLEKKTNGSDETTTSGSSTPNRSSQMSPVTASSATSIQTASSKGRFDGAHLFAGHIDALIPNSPRIPQPVVDAASEARIKELEEKLQELTTALEAATAKQTESEQELSLVRMEKEEVETTLGMELHSAQDQVRQLEGDQARLEDMDAQLKELEDEKEEWEGQRAELKDRQQEVEELKKKIEVLEAESGGRTVVEGALAAATAAHAIELGKKNQELEETRIRLETERQNWETEKAALMGDMNAQVAKLQQDAEVSSSATKGQLDEHVNSMTTLFQSHGIPYDTSNASSAALIASLGSHLNGVRTQQQAHAQAQQDWSDMKSQFETNLQANADKHDSATAELDQLRQERDDAKADARDLQLQLQAQTAASAVALAAAAASSASPPVEYKGDVAKIIEQLKPVWSILPSAEARASKLGGRSFRTGSPTGTPASPRGVGSSLSEMDVRSLKNLYDPKGYALSGNIGNTTFSIEAFVERVQALVTDDRALVERLIRFAQAHDLLKKNAERAQKLAQDSNAALETYQKQVNTLEERNISLMKQQAQLYVFSCVISRFCC